jgi:Tfp pilus assembly protein PilF
VPAADDDRPTTGGRDQPASEGLVYALYQQAQGHLDGGNASSAAEILELALEHEPGKASLHEALARAYFASSRVGRARAAFQTALELDPSNPYAHFGLGRCFEREGRLSDAAKHLKLAVAMADRVEYRQALDRVSARLDGLDDVG